MRIATILCTLAVAACGPTSYGSGVSASRIDQTTMQISARGNGWTDASTVREHALLRAAQETLKAGYGHFQVLSVSDQTRSMTAIVPGYTPQSMSYAVDIEKPAVAGVMRMYPGPKPPGAPYGWYDAREIVTHLGPKYGAR